MKRIALLLLLSLACVQMIAQAGFGKPENFNADWLFILQDDGDMAKADYDDSGCAP